MTVADFPILRALDADERRRLISSPAASNTPSAAAALPPWNFTRVN